MDLRPIRSGASKPMLCGLLLAAAVLWAAGCDGAAQKIPQQSRKSEGVSKMSQTQTAEQAAISIPPIDAAEPARLETATFATG